MNIFLLSPNIKESCQELAELDPIRARKQLVECCQLLATVDHIKKGSTNMIKADGTPCKMAHPHHPITKHMCVSTNNYLLCIDVAFCLSMIYKEYKSSGSFVNWISSLGYNDYTGKYCVVRKDHDTLYVNSLTEYSELMCPYVLAKIANNKEKVK